MIRETYKWLLAPMQEAKPGKGVSEVIWEHFPVNPGTQNFAQEIERVLKENELLIAEWAPIHLANVLRTWFWKDGARETNASEVWRSTCSYLYLPRLRDEDVFRKTLSLGAPSREFFGFAYAKKDEKYEGFSFGQTMILLLDSSLLLIEPGAAASFEHAQRAKEEAAEETGTRTSTETGANRPGIGDRPAPSYKPSVEVSKPAVKKQFYSSVDLDPVQAKRQFADIVEEVVMQFTSRPGVKVKISIEIQAESDSGFDEGLQRAVKENCNTLRFKNAEFEGGE
jgi:hypothetical protein